MMYAKPVSNETVLQQLRWRYATKRFDPARRIAPEDWQTLEQALVLSPSSFGLQPWRFLVIDDPALRAQLVPISWNQTQLVDASHAVVFALKKHVGLPEVERWVQRLSQVRQVEPARLEPYRQRILGHLVHGPVSLHVNDWAARQVYLALGNFMTCAAMMGIDTCPVEGFEPDKYDQLLGLGPRGLAATVVCVAGYRADDDKYAKVRKARFPAEEIIEHV